MVTILSFIYLSWMPISSCPGQINTSFSGYHSLPLVIAEPETLLPETNAACALDPIFSRFFMGPHC